MISTFLQLKKKSFLLHQLHFFTSAKGRKGFREQEPKDFKGKNCSLDIACVTRS
jgi:hypothetical protein